MERKTKTIPWGEIIKKYTPSKYKGHKRRFRLITDDERSGRWDEVVYSAKLLNRNYNGQSQLCIFIYKKNCKYPSGKVYGGSVEDIITVYLDVIFKKT